MSGDESDLYDLDSGLDLAAFAAVAPEPNIDETDGGSEDADVPVYVVGIGSRNLEYLTSRGRQAIQEADVVVGFETVVDFVADETDADLLTCGYADEADALAEFGWCAVAGDRGTVVLTGDPNHPGYQFLGKVQRIVERPVRMIPDISSLQIAASRARVLMEGMRFATLHKSGSLDADLDRLVEVAGGCHLLVLPRPFDWMPGDITELLLDSGVDVSLDALMSKRLTRDDERITRTTLDGLHDPAGGSGPDSTPYSDPSVPAVRAPADAAD